MWIPSDWSTVDLYFSLADECFFCEGSTLMWWGKRTWDQLDDSQWFESISADDGMAAARLMVAVMAIVWIYKDFGTLVEDIESDDPDWQAWYELFRDFEETSMDSLTMARTSEDWREIESAIVENETDGLDDILDLIREDLDETLRCQAMAFLVSRMRAALIGALTRTWGGAPRLAASLWASTWRGWATADEPEAETVPPRRDPELLLTTVEAEMVNERAESFYEDALVIGEEYSALRMAALEWVMEGCPIRNPGTPQFEG
ncbi:MAG: hypothetical protein GC162_00325 [Planctomycetes bacterium]|nr:hypothetical protein [Planctomycetota bacterium]